MRLMSMLFFSCKNCCNHNKSIHTLADVIFAPLFTFFFYLFNMFYIKFSTSSQKLEVNLRCHSVTVHIVLLT